MIKKQYIFLGLSILSMLYTGLDVILLNPIKDNDLPMTWNVIGFIVCFILFFFFLLYDYFANEIKKKKIKKTGIKATGILLSATETNTQINDQPEMILTFRVESINNETWEAKLRQVIPYSQMYSLVPGTKFEVYYDPNDKTQIAISD